jgi:hypothetical protein
MNRVSTGRQEKKMRTLATFALALPFIFLLTGCDLVSRQYSSTLYPPPQPGVTSGAQSSSVPTLVTPPQVTGAQRGQYLWDKALEGMALGGALAGPYGAGTGLVIGLLAGLFTADQHYTQLNTQIQTEQLKDQQLEAQIEQEIARQRELEAQLFNGAGNPVQSFNGAGNPAQQNQTDSPHSIPEATRSHVTAVAMREAANTVASLSSKESPSNSLTRPFRNVEIRDLNGDGIPDLWIYYSPLAPSEIVRQEEATRWDGRVDTWSYFKDGKLVRREVDTKGKGTADTVYYYESDKIVREERDEHGTGHVSFRALYQNGRRAKVEEDTSGGGKTDLWIYYDTSKDGEIVLKKERDLNGDGTVDLWSYYENGRLIRRDVSAIGLELLSKQDQLPSAPGDSQQIPEPKSLRESKGRI